MAAFANSEHLSQYYARQRADLAEVSFQHLSYTIDLVENALARIAAAIGPKLRQWATAHRQAVQDRIFWELALTDPRMMAELRAMHDRSEAGR